MVTQVDLRQLQVDRPAAGAGPARRQRGRLARWGVPLAIVGGFLGLATWVARDRWLPTKEVTIAPVLMTQAEVRQAGTPLFQAAGWVEPRPTAVVCTAQVEGIVEELLVVEGQEVERNQPVAKLIDADARINLRESESARQLRMAECDAAQAVLTAAKQNAEQPVQLQAAHAEAEASLAALETEIKNLGFQVQAAEAKLKIAAQDLEGKKLGGDAIAGRSLQKSQGEFDAATAALAELKQRAPNLLRQQEAWSRKCEALHTKLKLKTDETRALDEAKANLAAAKARLSQAEIAVETANLHLKRMTVLSPIKGRVLALNAQPGRRLMGTTATSERDASTVVTLYDPQKLQIRADVRLEDVGKVEIGQPVQITSAASKEPLVGQVLGITSQADIQKNTLQVKVSIENPPPAIRPEMLAQVVFLAPKTPGEKVTAKDNPLRLMVPKELVQSDGGGSFVWVADAARGVARKQSVQLGLAATDQLVEIAQGLNALDKLIVSGREGLEEGTRVRITGGDRSLGSSNSPHGMKTNK